MADERTTVHSQGKLLSESLRAAKPVADAALIERVRGMASLIERTHGDMGVSRFNGFAVADLRALCDAVVAQDKALQLFQVEKAQLVMDLGDAKSAQPDPAQDQDGLVGECRTAISDLESILVHGDPEVDNALEVFERAAAEIEALLKVGMKLNKRAVKAESERDEWSGSAADEARRHGKTLAERDELRRAVMHYETMNNRCVHESGGDDFLQEDTGKAWRDLIALAKGGDEAAASHPPTATD